MRRSMQVLLGDVLSDLPAVVNWELRESLRYDRDPRYVQQVGTAPWVHSTGGYCWPRELGSEAGLTERARHL